MNIFTAYHSLCDEDDRYDCDHSCDFHFDYRYNSDYGFNNVGYNGCDPGKCTFVMIIIKN